MAVTVVQTGFATAQNDASPSVTFGSTLTANNVICLGMGTRAAASATIPSGYTAGPNVSDTSQIDGYTCYKIAAGGETSAEFTDLPSSADSCIVYVELSGTDATTPLDGTSEDETNVSGTGATTIATDSGSGITPTLADGMAVAVFTCDSGAQFDNGTNSLDNSFTLQEDFRQTPSNNDVAALGTLQYSDTNAKKCTLTTTDTGGYNYGAMLLFKAAAGGADKKTVVLMRHRGH